MPRFSTAEISDVDLALLKAFAGDETSQRRDGSTELTTIKVESVEEDTQPLSISESLVQKESGDDQGNSSLFAAIQKEDTAHLLGHQGTNGDGQTLNAQDGIPHSPKIKEEPIDDNYQPSDLRHNVARQGKKRMIEEVDHAEGQNDLTLGSTNKETSPIETRENDITPPAKKTRAKRRPKATDKTCCTCLEEFPIDHIMIFDCCPETYYCRKCLEFWYASTLKNKTFPTCCNGEIFDNEIRDILSRATRARYRDVLEERELKKGGETPTNVVTVDCAKCRRYIRTSQIKENWGRCPTCKVKTCVECKSLRSEHKGIHNLCPAFLNDPAMASLGSRFTRCPKCFVMIELVDGCNELRCTCKCVFCFKCGNMAKKCSCPRQFGRMGLPDRSEE